MLPALTLPDTHIDCEYDTNRLKEALRHESAREWIQSLGKPVSQLSQAEKAFLVRMFG
jgi:hypothetical protein